ncbi:MAG: class I SAM-dependent methyltransferase [Kofleriaceae bacterium]
MSYVCYLLVAILVLDSIRMRGRLGKLAVLADSDAPPTGYRVFAAPGVEVKLETLRAAAAYARDHQLALLDLVPRNLGAMRALAFAQLVDPVVYRADRIGPGRTAGHAIVVSDEVAERARATTPTNDVELSKLAANLKHYGRADAVVAPHERARAQDLAKRYELLFVVLGPSTPLALGILVVMWALIGLGLWLAPIAGLVALAAWQLQPLIALAGTGVRSTDLIPFTILRAPIELYVLARTLLSPRPSAAEAAAKRPEYDALLGQGLARLYDPRRETCPLCDSKDLALHLRHGDLFQHKPGTFSIERCRACRHLFQNPRLSFAGLDFYYKDFYDGLGEAGMEFIFGFGKQPYLDRLAMVRAVAPPQRWLDVGAGHGHFCVAARGELPNTAFDGLDLSESIDEAKRRGWVDTAYRGFFTELAPSMAGRYDAVSMSHYLEHTIDPREELKAAHTALADNGCLLIEVPDPEFALGKLLRRYWLPWFQPQHLHFLSVANLDRLLRERGFTPVEWHRGKAHQRVDFFFAVWLFLDRIAPPRKLPWRWRGLVAGAWRSVVWTIGSPLILFAILFDNLTGPLWARAKISNTYRVVATKGAAS